MSVILRDKGVDSDWWHLLVVSSTALFVSWGLLDTLQTFDLDQFYDYCLTISQEVTPPYFDRGPTLLIPPSDKICMEDQIYIRQHPIYLRPIPRSPHRLACLAPSTCPEILPSILFSGLIIPKSPNPRL